MGELGHALAACIDAVDDEVAQRVADVIEMLMNTGTEEVQTGVATGLLVLSLICRTQSPTSCAY